MGTFKDAHQMATASALTSQMMKYEFQRIQGLNYVIGGKDSCQGDSGGPMYTRELVNGRERSYLVNILTQ